MNIMRKSLDQLPPSMADRAVKARKLAAMSPEAVQVDDDFLPWMYSYEDDLWYSFDGNYSATSPQEKRMKELERKKKEELYKEESLRRAAEDYYNIEFWSKVRLSVLRRDKYRCQICGKIGDSKLHVHHIMKRNAGGTDHLDNLITTCPSCHSKVDRNLYDPEWKNEDARAEDSGEAAENVAQQGEGASFAAL
jgi:rubrerythrin